MKRILGLLVFLVAFYSTALAQRQNLSGWCEKGNETVLTDGRNSTTKVQRSYPSCTVTVYDAGTLNLATIASDLGGTPKANPFTATTNGFWEFWAQDGRYDVRISGSGLATPFTFANQWVISSSGGSGDVTGPGSATDQAIARFNGTSGKIIQNSVLTLSSSGMLNFVDDVRQTFNPGANNAGINVGSSTADPVSPLNGDVYYNSSLGSFRCREAGAWINCASSGDVVGPGSATDNALVRFDLTTGKLIQNSTVIVGDTGNITGLGTLNTHTIPGGTDTFALLAASQTLSNKTLPDTTDFSGFVDFSNIAAPANPSAGQMRVFANNSTGFLSCLTSAGANCMPSGGGGGTPGGSSGQIQWNSAGSFAGISGSVVSALGEVFLNATPRTSGSSVAYAFQAPADTTLAADTESRLILFGSNGSSAVTRQFTAGGGAFATQREYLFFAPIYAFTSADTITNAATVAITDAPAQGANATFTNAYALWVQAGVSLFAGTVRTTASGTQAAILLGSHTADPSVGSVNGNLYYNSTANVFKGLMVGSWQTFAMTDFANAWGDGIRQTFNPSNGVSGLNVGQNASDPSTPVNGDAYYNTGSNKFRCYENGAWTNCIAAGGGAPGGASGTIQWNNAGAFEGIAGSVVTTLGEIKLNHTARTSGGSVRAFQQITSADTGLTADTESIYMQFGGTTASPPISGTRTFTAGGGTFPLQRENVFVHPTYAFNSSDTIPTAATVSITGAPVAGANATISQPLALLVEAGNAQFAANVGTNTLNVTGLIQTGPTSYGAATKTLDIRANTYTDLPNAEVIIDSIDLGFSTEMNFTGGGGAIANQRSFAIFRQGNITADAAQTITTGATLFIDGPPVAGTNVTITTALTAWFQRGAVRIGQPSGFDGSLQLAVAADANFTTIEAGTAPVSNVRLQLPNDDPAANDFLKVTSFAGGVAVLEWAVGGGGSSPPFVDTTSIVEGSADATKEIRFEVDGLTTGTIRVLTPPNANITIAGADFLNAWADGVTQTFNPNDTSSGINVGSNNAEPSSPNDGDIFYDGDGEQLKARINGAWVALGAGGAGCTPGGATGDYQINNGAGGCAAGVITQGSNGRVIASPTLTSSGAVSYFRVVTPVDTGQTADAEMPGIILGGSAASATVTRTGADGTTIALQREIRVVEPTYAFAGATTVTRAVTLQVDAAPIQGTNATLSRSIAFRVASGASEFPNGATSTPSISFANVNVGIFSEGGTTISFGASGNYAGGFLGGTPNGLNLPSNANIYWSTSTSSITTTTDASIQRHAAGVIRIGDSAGSSTPGQLLVGNSGDTIGAQLDVRSEVTTRVAFRADSLANTSVEVLALNLTPDDTSTLAPFAALTANSNGTPANGFGFSLNAFLESSTTNSRAAGSMNFYWQDATDASRSSAWGVSTVGGAAAAVERLSLFGASTFSTIYVGNGLVNATPIATGAVAATGGAGTNVNGSTLLLFGGISTGTGTPGQVTISYTTQSVSSGTGSNAQDNGQYVIPTTNFTQTSTVQVANTTTETTVIGTQVGDGIIGAGILRPGRTITIDLAGYAAVTATPNLILRFKLGSTTVLTKTFTALPNTANRELKCRVVITGRTFSATGTVIAQGYCMVVDGLTTQYTATGFETTTTTVDLTTDQAIAITAQWSAASASNAVNVTNIVANVNN
jgi:hypothetical protein